MTREQAKEKLVALGIAEPTEEQITAFLNSVNGEVQKEKDETAKYKTDAAKAKELQKRVEELEKQGMTDVEKTTKELEEAKNKIAELEKNGVAAEVKAIFGVAGLTEDDYKDFIDGFAGFDLETAKTKAAALVKTIENTKTATDKKVREELLDGTKGADGGGDGDGDDKKPDDVKNAESISFGKVDSKAVQSARDYYK